MFQDESGLAILSFINSHSAQNIPLGTTSQLPYYLQECRRRKCKYTQEDCNLIALPLSGHNGSCVLM